MIIKTVTGWVVRQEALDSYAAAYRIAGNREDAINLQHDEAHRENWARDQVAAAGKSWDTHMAKFDGTVLPR